MSVTPQQLYERVHAAIKALEEQKNNSKYNPVQQAELKKSLRLLKTLIM